MTTGPIRRWNFFARELEEILAQHGQHLSNLGPHMGVAEEKVRRLQQSLLAPGNFPVLAPEELAQLALELDLEDNELIRLRAALLITELEQTLLYQLGPEQTALLVETIAPAITRTLRDRLQRESRMGAKRGPEWEALDTAEKDWLWEDIQKALNSAALALQLSSTIPARRPRVKKLQKAAKDFQEALDLLESLDEGSKRLSLWTHMYREARRGFDAALASLDNLSQAD